MGQILQPAGHPCEFSVPLLTHDQVVQFRFGEAPELLRLERVEDQTHGDPQAEGYPGGE